MAEISNSVCQTARLATLDELLKTTVRLYFNPPPARDTLRAWLDAAKVPRFKSNPTAKRGGGPCYYQVSAVEKLFRARTMTVRLAQVFA